LFGADAEVHNLVDEPPVMKKSAMVRPVRLVLGSKRVADIPPVLRAGEQHRWFRISKTVVVPAYEVVGQAMPRVDGNLDEGSKILFE
jgi:hypothetical protein